MNINSSNYYSVSAATNSGISGLASGMDTESMVKKMLSGTQKKIDQQEALKQQTQWKQAIYQDATKAINAFYGKYFDSSYGSALDTNFAGTDFFDTMISKVKAGNSVNVISAGPTAQAGDVRVSVKSLASKTRLEAQKLMSFGRTIDGAAVISEDIMKNFNRQLVLSADGQKISVDLNGIKDQTAMAEKINAAFAGAGLGSRVAAKIFEGKLRVIGADPSMQLAVDSGSTALALEMTGLANITATALAGIDGAPAGKMLQGADIKEAAGVSFDLALNGVTKTIVLNPKADPSGLISLSAVKDDLSQQIGKAFGSYVSVTMDEQAGKLKLALGEGTALGQELRITGIDAGKLGFTPGASTAIDGGTKLSELGLAGSRSSFTINGEAFTFDHSVTLGAVMKQINSSSANVKLSYSSLSDKFVLEAAETGAKYGIEITQSEGNLLNALFGDTAFQAPVSVVGKLFTTGKISGSQGGLSAGYSTASASLSMTVNGKKHTFTLPEKQGAVYAKDTIESAFNAWLKTTFGQQADGAANILYENGSLTIGDGYAVSFEKTAADLENAQAAETAKKTDLALAFGFSVEASTNIAADDTAVADILQLKNTAVFNAAGTTPQTLREVHTINGYAVEAANGRLLLKAPPGQTTVDLSADAAMQELFGGAGFTFSDGAPAANSIAAGKDALVSMNGVDFTRSGNSFVVDGLTLELTKEDKLDAATGKYEETLIGTGRDTDKIAAGFKSFVADYNTMLDKLNGYLDEDPNYRSYQPLTEAQKKEMSEREIELWEKKAKQGLVRRDTYLADFVAQMRETMYSKPAGAAVALYNIGIGTSGWNKKGKLSLDETILRSALSSNIEDVKRLFTQAADGLAARIGATVNAAAKTSVGSPGALVRLAGAEDWSANAKQNTFYEKIQTIESRLSDLKGKYEKERQRYWNQFNQMESILANYNTQGNMITQYFSGS